MSMEHTKERRALTTAMDAERALQNMTGPECVTYAQSAIMDTQAALGRLSGLTQNTLRAFKEGKRPTAAQRAALCWAIFRRWAP